MCEPLCSKQRASKLFVIRRKEIISNKSHLFVEYQIDGRMCDGCCGHDEMVMLYRNLDACSKGETDLSHESSSRCRYRVGHDSNFSPRRGGRCCSDQLDWHPQTNHSYYDPWMNVLVVQLLPLPVASAL